MSIPAGRAQVWTALITLYILWGSTYLGILIAIRTFPPFLMLGARFLIAGLLLYAWSIRKGDRIFYYHTGKEKSVVAVAKALSDAYPDPADDSGKLHVVDIGADKKLSRPVTLAEIKADRAFASFPLVRMSRLSVMPVTDAEWTRIEKMSKS